MKKITFFITAIMLFLSISTLAAGERKPHSEPGNGQRRNKFSIARKMAAAAPVAFLAGGVAYVAKNLFTRATQETQPSVTIKSLLLQHFKEYQDDLIQQGENAGTQQEQINAYIDENYTELYLELMRNYDSSQGPVLWGGNLELTAIANQYKIRIKVIDIDGGYTTTIGEVDEGGPQSGE